MAAAYDIGHSLNRHYLHICIFADDFISWILSESYELNEELILVNSYGLWKNLFVFQPEGVEKEYTFNSLVCPKGLMIIFKFMLFLLNELQNIFP